MARNRKRSRGGNSPQGRTPSPIESGETQLTEVEAGLGRPPVGEVPSEVELTKFEEDNASGNGGGNGNGAELTATGGAGKPPAERGPGILSRLIGFLEGSWRELQRVQWPDRRQVFQATGVVLGFVIVAGAFLGVASFAAQKVVNLILYGHG